LRREFGDDYYLYVVQAKALEFLDVRRVLEDFTAPLNFLRLRTMLRDDFQKLRGLMDAAPPLAGDPWGTAWLAFLYFRLVLGWVTLSRLLRLPEKPGLLKLTVVLQYLANLAGERISWMRVTNPAFTPLFAHVVAGEDPASEVVDEFAPEESSVAPGSTGQERWTTALVKSCGSGGYASSW
jgi:hypothetical protein